MKVYVMIPKANIMPKAPLPPPRTFSSMQAAIDAAIAMLGYKDTVCTSQIETEADVWAGCAHPHFFSAPEIKITAVELEEHGDVESC